MALDTIYGINGVGKDTVAHELAADNVSLSLTSESRVLMYILGICNVYDSRTQVSRDQYRRLEDTPQSKMLEISGTDYKEFVGNLQNSRRRTLMLSHLVFALYLDKAITYLSDKDVPEWYVGANHSLIHLIAPSETIYLRRSNNKSTRDRGNFTESDVKYHQELCNIQWAKVSKYAAKLSIPTATISNLDLRECVSSVKEVIYVNC